MNPYGELRISCQRPQFGFGWLCFLSASKHEILHNHLSYRYLHSFRLTQIGFVFSNSPFSSPSGAGWQPQSRRLWGWLVQVTPPQQIGFNWLCFFKSYPFTSFRISILGFRISGRRPADWL